MNRAGLKRVKHKYFSVNFVLVVVNDFGTNLVSEEWPSRDCDLTLAQHECPECASENTKDQEV